MGACNTKNKDKIKVVKASTTQSKPMDAIQPEIVVSTITQSIPKSGIVDTKPQIKVEKIVENTIRKFKVKLISDDATIHEGIYQEDTELASIIRDASQRMKMLLLNTHSDIEYPGDFDFILISQKVSSDFANPLKEKINITDRQSQNLKSILSSSLNDNKDIIIEITRSGLEISRDIRKALIEGTNILAAPKFESDPFEIIIYEKKTNNIIYYLIQDPTFDYMKSFSNFSAYCNGYNKLFISGGALNEDEYLPTFVELDLDRIAQPNHLRKLPNLNVPRSWHSMIFVPPRYVFIVGGSNTKSVEIYNTDTNEIKQDSNLNESRSEPSLCVVNNSCLFAFCGFLLMHNYVNTIEKCNLKKKKRNWEIVNLKFDKNLIFEPSFFTVAYEKGNSIVLLGGHEQKGKRAGKNYIFRQVGHENIIENYSLNEVEDSYVCSEKFFCPLDEKDSVLIPSYMSDTVKILHFNSEMGLVYQMKFEAMVESTRDVKPSLGSQLYADRDRRLGLDNFPVETSDV